jgi:hypothetical protein
MQRLPLPLVDAVTGSGTGRVIRAKVLRVVFTVAGEPERAAFPAKHSGSTRTGIIMSWGLTSTRGTIFAGIAALAVVAGVSTTAHAGDRAAVTDWTIADVSDTAGGGLSNVVALGPKNAWAFGGTGDAEGRLAPMARHWNGRSWTAVTLPPGLEKPISEADATGPGNVWAFGGGDAPGDVYALRWNGHRWRVMKRWPGDQYIGDVEVLGPRDVWVFGNPGLASTSIDTLHFDGRRWNRVETPVGFLSEASAVASDDIWAIAGSRLGPNDLLARWNGRAWNEVTVPGLPHEDDHYAHFSEIHATSSHDVWAVGEEIRSDGETRTSSPLVLHFDGQRWQTIDLPPIGSRSLSDVTSDGQGGIWVTPETGEPDDPELLHYGQGQWTVVRPQRPDGREVSVWDVTAVPRSLSAWAVGGMYDPATGKSDNVIWANGAPLR